MAEKYSVIKLSGTIRETGRLAKSLPAGREEMFRLDEFRCRIEELVKNKSTEKVLIDCRSDFRPRLFVGFGCGSPGGLKGFPKAGKELHFCGRDLSTVGAFSFIGLSVQIYEPLRQSFLSRSVQNFYLFPGKPWTSREWRFRSSAEESTKAPVIHSG